MAFGVKLTSEQLAARKAAAAPRIMQEFDRLPPAARAIVNEYGDAAWHGLRLGISPTDLRKMADENGGVLVL